MQKADSGDLEVRKIALPMVVILGLTTGLLSLRLWQPFWGNHEFNGVYYGQIARNYLRYGVVATRGGQVNNLYETDKADWSYHKNHPATYPLLIALVFKIFGVGEVGARATSVLASAVGMALVAQLVMSVFNQRSLWLAVLPILVTPLFLYYGSVPVFEPILLPIVATGLLAYYRYQREGKSYWLVVMACLLAALIDWPGYWLVVWLVVDQWRRRKKNSLILWLVGSGAMATLLIAGHQWLISGNIWTDLVNVAESRLAYVSQPYSAQQWLALLASRTKAFLGLPVIVGCILGAIALVYRGDRNQQSLVVLVWIIGLSHLIVFRNITWYHDYMLYHILIGVGLLLGSGLMEIRRWLGNGGLVVSVIVFMTLSVWQTQEFYTALVKQRPHQKCVAMGRMVKDSRQRLNFAVTAEEAKTCPPFVGFYGNKPFSLTISE